MTTEENASTTQCPNCGRPLHSGDAGGFCLGCLLSPAKEWLDRTQHPLEADPAFREDWEPGDQIDRYQLEEKIGEGGFGVVYRALQVQPMRREVALKVLKSGMASRDIVARFEGERQALAMMDHPNVARVYDAGTTFAGSPYFVMELVKGRPITTYCRDLPLEDRLRLFVQACRGVQHAHLKGIIHRDIKPSNVLVMGEGVISVAKVIDFGIAKALEQPLADKTIYTAHGQVMGTLQYMSPEQALSAGVDVDTRSDVYSLGVVLYEILTGTTPLAPEMANGNDLAKSLQAIRDETPLRPSVQLEKRLRVQKTVAGPLAEEITEPVTAAFVRGDLDWIVMKALEKERHRRYPSVAALMEDVERFLKQEPVQARAPTARYRVVRFAKRNTLLLRSVAVLALVLALATIATGWLAFRAFAAESATRSALASEAAARLAAARQEGETRSKLVRLSVITGDEMVKDGDYHGALLWYAEALRLDRDNPEDAEMQRRRFGCVFRTAPHLVKIWPGAVGGSFSKDGEKIAITSADGTAQVWSRTDLRPEGPRLSVDGDLQEVRFSHDTTRLLGQTRRGDLVRWNLESGVPVSHVSATGSAEAASSHHPWELTSDGRWGAVVTPAGPARFQAALPDPLEPVVPGAVPARQIRLSADGSRLAAAHPDWGVRVWDAGTRELLFDRNDFESAVAGFELSPDGQRLAVISGTNRDTLEIWKVNPAERLHASIHPGGSLLDCEFCPQGTQVAVGSGNSFARIFDVASGKPVTERLLHNGAVSQVRFSADGGRLSTAAYGEMTLRIWDAPTGRAVIPWITQPAGAAFSEISADGEWLLTGDRGGLVRLWHVPSASAAERVLDHGAELITAVWCPWGERLVSLGSDGKLRLWEVGRGKPLGELAPATRPTAMAWSPDGEWLLAGGADGVVERWQVKTLRQGKALPRHGPGTVTQLQFVPDGSSYLSLCDRGTLKFWDWKTGAMVKAPVSGDVGPVRSVEYDRAGRKLLTLGAGPEGRTRVWDLKSGQPGVSILTPQPPLIADLSPDGRLVVTGGNDNQTVMWDGTAGSPVGQRFVHQAPVLGSAFSPEGRLVATCSADGVARVWDSRTGTAISPPWPQEAGIVSWNRECAQLLTASRAGVMSIWNVAPIHGSVGKLRAQAELLAGRRLDSSLGLVVLTADEVLQRWRELEGDLVSGNGEAARLPSGSP